MKIIIEYESQNNITINDNRVKEKEEKKGEDEDKTKQNTVRQADLLLTWGGEDRNGRSLTLLMTSLWPL